jgi:hypothetical protein
VACFGGWGILPTWLELCYSKSYTVYKVRSDCIIVDLLFASLLHVRDAASRDLCPFKPIKNELIKVIGWGSRSNDADDKNETKQIQEITRWATSSSPWCWPCACLVISQSKFCQTWGQCLIYMIIAIPSCSSWLDSSSSATCSK